jgi:hypothetical protein
VAAVLGATLVIYREYGEPWWQGLVAVLLCAATAVTGSYHTGFYDHAKNIYLRLTHESYTEGEDVETAERRRRERLAGGSWIERLCWPPYLFYVRSQERVVRWLDPHAATALSRLPAYEAARAARYRELALPVMRELRAWFGFGSLVFGISVSLALGVIEYYMLFRLIVLNGLFVAHVLPRQRRVSRLASAELGLERVSASYPPALAESSAAG